ncbi:hypothetical protein LOD99_15135 [Oopsacas minuta]|uniref:Uncharacterized protein n=1 Tax=Oopsacas minuta TaxID=111878 RepID=A0AAV7KDN8_9METZ|nr:hypothetical protein LOD99_15135 [Oopsacas minuta]
MDFCFGRHQQRVGYGGIIACGLTDEWEWFQFPLRLENLDEIPHYPEFTFKIFDEAFCSDLKPRYPIFVTTDNENKMKAAFDGRWDTADHNFEVELVAQGMHCQRISPKYSTLNQQGTADWYYRTRAKKLVRAIPGKSTTRPWSSHDNRFLAAVHNYVVYLKEDDNSVVDNLPSLALLKSVLTVLEQVKLFFERVEVDHVISHLSFVNYLLIDMFLFNRQIDESEYCVTGNLCQDLRGQMEQKLWMYSGSAFSQSAAFLSDKYLIKYQNLHKWHTLILPTTFSAKQVSATYFIIL